jgi:hypothetical protein
MAKINQAELGIVGQTKRRFSSRFITSSLKFHHLKIK